MIVRKSTLNDLSEMLNIYEHARSEMIKNGNSNQWGTCWPPEDVIKQDIMLNQSYVVLDKDAIVGTFACIEGIEETYLEIEGAWLNNDEYVTIHRLASNNKVPGVFNTAVKFMTDTFKRDIRIDTHEQNTIMNHLILKEGFIYTGIIYVYNGLGRGRRVAYQKIYNNENA